MLPAYVAAISAVLLILHAVAVSRSRTTLTSYVVPSENDTGLDASEPTVWRRHVARVGGPRILAHRVLRLSAILVLTVLAINTGVGNGWTRFDVALVATMVCVGICWHMDVY